MTETRLAAAFAQGRLDVSEPIVWAEAPHLVTAVLALGSGGYSVIAADWRVAKMALQVIAEQGPGMGYAAAEAAEDAQLAALARSVRRG